MAISKVIFNGQVLMDVTNKTVDTDNLLSNETALKNDGTDVVGGIATKSSSDLTASGATVTAPAGYYASAASKSVASGTVGTPTATKGTVSNHSVSVTPSVTNATGYITGGTKNGTAVTVTAAELVSGSQTVTTNNTYDVTNLAEVVVNVSGGGGTGAVAEQGEITVDERTGGLTIPFTDSHSTPPCFFSIAMETSGQTFSQYPQTVVIAISGCNFVDALGVSTIETKSSSPYHMCGQVLRTIKSSSSALDHTAISCTTDAATKWSTYVSDAGLNMPTSDTYHGTYKWIAIWNSWGG